MKFLRAEFIFLVYFCIRCSALDISHYRELSEEREQKKKVIPILKHSFQQSHEGYKYSFETANGIQAQEAGYIKNLGDKKKETLVQQGTITYLDEHGHPITLHYIADENGFQPKGAHLPTPPPIPEEIQKALDAKYQQEPENRESHNEFNLYHQVPRYQYENLDPALSDQEEAQQDY